MRQSRTRKPQKPLIRKNRDRVPPTKCSGTNRMNDKSDNAIYTTLEQK